MKTHALTGLCSNYQDSLEAIQDQIRARAYQLYEQRGRENGHDVDDWLEAESERARKETRQ